MLAYSPVRPVAYSPAYPVGGRPDDFLPAIIPGVALWLRADRNITPNGSGVSQWGGLVNANNATQSTEASQPTFDADAIGGKPGVVFDGSGDNMIAATAFAGTTFSIFVVMQFVDLAAVNNLITTRAASNSGFSFDTAAAGPLAEFRLLCHDSGGATLATSGTLSINTPYIGEGHIDGTNIQAVLNGTAGVAVAGAMSASTTPLNLVGPIGGAGGSNFGGPLAEVTVFSPHLSVANRAQVRQYLSIRHSIALAS